MTTHFVITRITSTRISSINIRAVLIPGLESAPEYDRSMILKCVGGDSGSGSFQVDPLESAPVLVDPIVGAF